MLFQVEKGKNRKFAYLHSHINTSTQPNHYSIILSINVI